MSPKNFGWALDQLLAGKRVYNSDWVSGEYIWLMPPAVIKAEWCREPHLKSIAENNGGEIKANESIRKLMSDGTVLTGWVPSQTEMFSTNWNTV